MTLIITKHTQHNTVSHCSKYFTDIHLFILKELCGAFTIIVLISSMGKLRHRVSDDSQIESEFE